MEGGCPAVPALAAVVSQLPVSDMFQHASDCAAFAFILPALDKGADHGQGAGDGYKHLELLIDEVLVNINVCRLSPERRRSAKSESCFLLFRLIWVWTDKEAYMAEIVNFNAQIAHMEHVEKVVRQEQEHAQTSRQALLRQAPRLLSKDKEQVREALPGQGGRRVEDEDRSGGEKRHPGSRHERGPRRGGEPEEKSGDFPADVWSGNIVNLKV
ncbi:MAG: hypothetical protein LBD82_02300 [Deltaproteobacteria bacterium]|nr:hypothetical protein [Deltaproteobacteria bacterium]